MIAINTTHCIDVLEGLKKLDDKSVQLVISSPPYNVSWRSDKRKYMTYDDNRPENEFIKWQLEVFKELNRVLKDDGVVLWNFNYGARTLDLPYKLVLALQRSGLTLYETIIWQKLVSLPLTHKNDLTRNFEFIWLFAKNRDFFMNKDKKTLYKVREYFPNNYFSNVWTFKIHIENQFSRNKNVSEDFEHHAVFPVDLPKLGVLLYSKEGDLILDPFMGSGTTGVSAKEHGRNFVGFDLEQKYCDMANKKIEYKRIGEF